MTDLRQTPEYANYLSSLGWIVEKKEGVNYFVRKFPLIGSFIKVQRPEKIDYQYIHVLVVKHRAYQIVIEPKNTNHQILITNYGFRQSRNYFVPSKTVQINLTKSEKQLLKEMHYKTRYNIRKTQSSKLKVQKSKDINLFANFWQGCALKQRGMFIPQKKEIRKIYKAFEKKADLIFVLHSNEPVAGILLLHAEKISYYMYAASSNLGKKLFAPTLAAWEAIRLSKKKGSRIFDFEGIYDNRFPLNSWLGFTRFKKSFGGKEIRYPGAFTKFSLPF